MKSRPSTMFIMLLLLLAHRQYQQVQAFSSNMVQQQPQPQQPSQQEQQEQKQHADPTPNMDWDSFKFGLNGVRTNAMWVDRIPVDQAMLDRLLSLQLDKNDSTDTDTDTTTNENNILNFGYSSCIESCLQPLSNNNNYKLELVSPLSTVLSYAQAVFEGLKAFRRRQVDDGTSSSSSSMTIALFRPQRNALRMQRGAQRWLLPPVSTEIFLQATKAVVRANAAWVPPMGQGALYLRPMLLGSGEALGAVPSHQATFCVFCSPVGNYFPGTALASAIRLQAVQGFGRAAPGGCGNVKASGNYAPAFFVQRQVKARGFDDILCLDAVSWEAIEEAGAANFFAVFAHNNTLITPDLAGGTILDGVTRASILELAERECGLHVIQGRLTLTDLKGASEAFCCGTGASVTPVGHVSVIHTRNPDQELDHMTFGNGKAPGPITQRLHQMLLDIQMGTNAELNEKYADWIVEVEP